ncbi:MAG: outer membrane beta-barrel protein, partial [Hyphomicrobiales bacterium]|nr:outer membrane beta-barrel protein [Hyphomicrobiales bacterium]
LANGEVLSQKERDSLLATVKLRTGYDISPALTPFAELEVGRREYDVTTDSAGFRRSSDRLALRAGVELDMGEKLRGEIAAGWLRERPDDDRLSDISTPTLDANLRWSPERGTDVTLFGSTTVETTDTPDQSGSLLYTGRLSVDRQIRANLTGNASLGAAWRDYVGSDGHDLTLSAEVGLTWWLNRYLGITGRARHEQLESNLEGRDVKTDTVFLGVRLQR